MPDLTLLPDLFSSAISISIVAIAIHISLAKMFAKKMNYKIDSGQVEKHSL